MTANRVKLTICDIRYPIEMPSLSKYSPSPFVLNEFDDQRDYEGVNRDSFGEGETQNHVRLDLPGGLRIAADGFHGLATQDTHADARADSAKTDGQSGGEVPCYIDIHARLLLNYWCSSLPWPIVAVTKNTRVNIMNTTAWMKPTKTSRP